MFCSYRPDFRIWVRAGFGEGFEEGLKAAAKAVDS
jgi:hypothetical protein